MAKHSPATKAPNPNGLPSELPVNATAPNPIAAKAGVKNDGAPWMVAGRLLDKFVFMEDSGGQVFIHNGSHWEPVSDASLLYLLLEHGGRGAVLSRVRNEALSYLKARTHRRDLV